MFGPTRETSGSSRISRARTSHASRGRCGFSPTVGDLDEVIDRLVKIVGVTDDQELMAEAERAIRERFDGAVSASRSQTYYLDVTHPDANKGNVVAWLSAFLGIPLEHIATIGDGPNDILMFRRSGLSIAMGNASPGGQGRSSGGDLVQRRRRVRPRRRDPYPIEAVAGGG